jgi:hypothetical protein
MADSRDECGELAQELEQFFINLAVSAIQEVYPTA